MKHLVIAGAGSFGREVFAMIQDINLVAATWDVLGFLDDNPRALDGFALYPPILGPIEDYRKLQSPYVVCAIGSPKIRKQIVQRLDLQDAQWTTIIHPTASIGLGSTLGEGCVLCIRSIVTVDVKIGNHVHINCLASSGHDACIGDFCTLSGHVDVCGLAVLEEGAFLGSHAAILPNVRVGAWALIGAGSVVINDIPSGKSVFGAPARGVFAGRSSGPENQGLSKTGLAKLAATNQTCSALGTQMEVKTSENAAV